MEHLTEEQVHLIREYLDLLSSIKEGFEYVIASYEDYSKTEADLILSDIFSAFVQIISSNEDLEKVFAEQREIILALQEFQQVVVASEKLAGLFDKTNAKQTIVNEDIFPAYQAWHSKIEPLLRGYQLA
ncbi:hypothetical protein [Psychrobacillus sp. MER TA 171]|uniref:hypothetical protein n=1 Tax=Psychrobacillus sp. MER TA 171 TaxID=2939577 RepID=UPI002040989E|nr:hypothetical protein [Psychrobacillus sp. MER TA 171]MCM3356763.1 hypothetical protein [Psychrobacillus sp. MER TA 171]